jgi:hypothetical protein
MSSSCTWLFYSFVGSHELFKVEVRKKKQPKQLTKPKKKKNKPRKKKLIKKIFGSVQGRFNISKTILN